MSINRVAIVFKSVFLLVFSVIVKNNNPLFAISDWFCGSMFVAMDNTSFLIGFSFSIVGL